jgi:hypothetical protein
MHTYIQHTGARSEANELTSVIQRIPFLLNSNAQASVGDGHGRGGGYLQPSYVIEAVFLTDASARSGMTIMWRKPTASFWS